MEILGVPMGTNCAILMPNSVAWRVRVYVRMHGGLEGLLQ